MLALCQWTRCIHLCSMAANICSIHLLLQNAKPFFSSVLNVVIELLSTFCALFDESMKLGTRFVYTLEGSFSDRESSQI